MAVNQIWGVAHASKKELNTVIDKLIERKPSLVGLELTEDCVRVFEEEGCYDPFFYPIAQQLEKMKIGWSPLESTELSDRYKALTWAQYVKQGQITRESIQNRLLEMSMKYPHLKSLRHQHKLALKALDSIKTLEEIVARLDQCVAQRNNYMANRINSLHPDLVIMGHQHGKAIAEKLQDYQCIDVYLEFGLGPSCPEGEVDLPSNDLYEHREAEFFS